MRVHRWLAVIRGGGPCRFGEAGHRWVRMQAPTRCSTNATEVTVARASCLTSLRGGTIVVTIELGVTITEATVDEKVTTIFCTPVTRNPRCPLGARPSYWPALWARSMAY